MSAQGLKPEGGVYLVRDSDWANQLRCGKILMAEVTSEFKRFVWYKDT